MQPEQRVASAAAPTPRIRPEPTKFHPAISPQGPSCPPAHQKWKAASPRGPEEQAASSLLPPPFPTPSHALATCTSRF